MPCECPAISASLPDGNSLQGNNAYSRGYKCGFQSQHLDLDPSIASYQLCDFTQVTRPLWVSVSTLQSGGPCLPTYLRDLVCRGASQEAPGTRLACGKKSASVHCHDCPASPGGQHGADTESTVNKKGLSTQQGDGLG